MIVNDKNHIIPEGLKVDIMIIKRLKRNFKEIYSSEHDIEYILLNSNSNYSVSQDAQNEVIKEHGLWDIQKKGAFVLDLR